MVPILFHLNDFPLVFKIPNFILYKYTPGASVITLIPYFPKSLAIGNVIPITAPLLAEYTVYPF